MKLKIRYRVKNYFQGVGDALQSLQSAREERCAANEDLVRTNSQDCVRLEEVCVTRCSDVVDGGHMFLPCDNFAYRQYCGNKECSMYSANLRYFKACDDVAFKRRLLWRKIFNCREF